MHIESKFIDHVVQSFHAICPDDERLCVAKNMFNNPDYSSTTFQAVYALRYVPAYYFEYCILADNLATRVGKCGIIKIASLGAGLCQDYYALSHNLSVPFEYTAFDAVAWKCLDSMPPRKKNFKHVAKPAQKISERDLSEFDVFVFPKSLTDIAGSGKGALSSLGANIAKSKKKRLFFLVSYISAGIQRAPASQDFMDIDKALKEAGFSTTDKVGCAHYLGAAEGEGLRKLHGGFVYPANATVTCKSKGGLKCMGCDAVKSPIFKNTHMSYSIMEYTK